MEKRVSRREFLKTSAAAGVLFSAGAVLAGTVGHAALGGEPQPIQLSKPRATGGNPLIGLLEKRASSREFAPDPLPVPLLSGLLWAAFGVNRPDGRRTAPSARNGQEIDVYVAAHDGLYLYDPKGNLLRPLASEDVRGLTGTQPFVRQAAVNLVYVADTSKMGGMAGEEKALWIGADTGVIVENVYLFCAAEGLATVVRAMIDRPALAKAMKLRPDQTITLSQSVGFPKRRA